MIAVVPRALGDQICVELEALPNTTEGGVHLPDTVEETSCKGVVRSKGRDVTQEIEVGARVLVSKYAGVEHKEGDVLYLFMASKGILALL